MNQKKFDYFLDIEHFPLRMYNCSVYAHNLLEDTGLATVKEYLESFPIEERVYMRALIKMVKEKGVKKVQELVTNGVKFSDEEWKEAVLV